MGRYLTQVSDRAEELKTWVQELAEETNKSLKGSELYDVSLSIRDPFEISGQWRYNGFVGLHLRFTPNEPVFLTTEDRALWYSRMRDVAERRFHISRILAKNLDYTSIDFEEPSETELYLLTPRKESIIRLGFDRVRRYAEWYGSAVKDYSKVIQSHQRSIGRHLSNLETL